MARGGRASRGQIRGAPAHSAAPHKMHGTGARAAGSGGLPRATPEGHTHQPAQIWCPPPAAPPPTAAAPEAAAGECPGTTAARWAPAGQGRGKRGALSWARCAWRDGKARRRTHCQRPPCDVGLPGPVWRPGQQARLGEPAGREPTAGKARSRSLGRWCVAVPLPAELWCDQDAARGSHSEQDLPGRRGAHLHQCAPARRAAPGQEGTAPTACVLRGGGP